jgi:ADP-ribose pyrophosphatase YjhB (NUDIX family)
MRASLTGRSNRSGDSRGTSSRTVVCVSTLADDDLVLEPAPDSAEQQHAWTVTLAGEKVGTIALRREADDTASVRWDLGRDDQSTWTGARALRLVVEHAFEELGYRRVEARIPVDRMNDIRAGSIGGLRREGIVRGPGEDPDRALLGRLHHDPPASSREGFIALLNAGLPTKRVIAQGLLRDEQDRVLLCRLTYKKEWDLPGGVVEVGEAPALGLVRELEEELGVTVDVGDLLTVNWLPAWRGWDDACVFLFDLGRVDASYVDSMRLQPTEIVGVEWCDAETVRSRGAAAAIELLAAVETGDLPAYREAPRAPE